MKNLRPLCLQAGLAFIMIAFLSSCGSFRDQFSSQRYTNFKVSHHSETKESASFTTVKSDPEQVNSSAVVPGTEFSVGTHEQNIVSENGGTVTGQEQKMEPVINTDQKKVDLQPLNQVRRSLNYAKSKMPKGDSSVPAWVLVLLCIFLAPLAVFLVEKASTRFWVTLIFTVIFVLYPIAIVLAFIACFGS
jgi:hypothetical protein